MGGQPQNYFLLVEGNITGPYTYDAVVTKAKQAAREGKNHNAIDILERVGGVEVEIKVKPPRKRK